MKALTIYQPWASLIMAGFKPFEFRKWAAPNWVAGQRIVIHASARKVRPFEIVDLLERIEQRNGGTGLKREARQLLLDIDGGRIELPLASGLGTALLGRPRRVMEVIDKLDADSDRVDHHIWAWPLSDPRPFEPFVPCRGLQGFWNWPERT